MTERCIVLLGPNAAQCERARARGLSVLVIDTAARLAPGVLELADHLILTDYTDIALTAALLRPFVERQPFVGVLSLTEHGLLASAQLNAEFGFADNEAEAVERVVRKDLMRAWLVNDDRYRLPARVIAGATELRDFVDEISYPVILKPAEGAGSEGIVFLDSDDSLSRWASAAPRLPVLAERFVSGAEYSVEAYSRDGKHVIVAVTEKLLHSQGLINQFVEVGHCVPAILPDGQRSLIQEYVRDFLTLIGIRWGLSHTEVIAADSGFVVVETHTRNGGDRIVDLVRLATGVDLIDVAITIRTGESYTPEAVPQQSAAVRFLMVRPGTIRAIAGTHIARSMPGVIDVQLVVGVGDTLSEIASSDDRAGMIVAIGASPSQAAKRAEKAAGAIRFTMSD